MSNRVNENNANKVENQKENVILLSMSTLPQTIKTNKFQYLKENRSFWGKSQLTPDTKTILSILDSKNEGIDRIVILATKEAQEKKERILEDEDGNKIGNINTDAVSFFQQEILDYVENCKKNPSDDEYCLKNLSLEEENFVVVDLDKYGSENEEEVIFDAVKAIKGDNHGEIELYINMQGGIRSTMMKMNAITELLETQNVKVVGRYANNYNAREPQPYISASVADDYRLYELVTAMAIFKKYGHGEKLLEYFRDASKDSFEKKLAKAIKLAADSIQLCDVDGFDEAIETIREIDKIYEESKAAPTLKIIYQDIKSDYAPILYAQHKYVAQIRWCLEKGFLQQSMTILESKMPDEYVRSGIVYYCKKGQEEVVLEQLMKLYDEEYVKINKDKNGNEIRTESKDSYLMKNINHFFINSMVGFKKDRKEICIRDKFEKYKIEMFFGSSEENNKTDVRESYVTYRKIKKIRNEMNHAQSKHSDSGFCSLMLEKKKNEPKGSRIYEIFKDKQRMSSRAVKDMIEKYLDEWEKLADQVPKEVKEKVADIS